ncbi:alpha/beta fold hydrolase [Hydrogenophaga sp.]|uniref:alpha/beta fold hydrolase n=1 Tax=Hydrogenophaga sp. TaxID=1904254 RepID=UPI002716C32C|nr:alpha/beta hydrolase [Hydrogenophaga sp.]MDO8904804.1 alpha/beta hydrolase [Hydrogenophaga sp.]
MNRLEIEGVCLEVREIAGPQDRAPLVFLHEGLGSVSMWTQRGRDWPTELCAAAGRPGMVYSRRGYGQSDPVPHVRGAPGWDGFWHTGRHEPDYMHLEAWQVLPVLLQKAGLQSPILVGHSDGATIALLHASRHPVTACIAMAPHVAVEEMAIKAIAQAKEMFEKPSSSQGFRQRLARHHGDVDNAFWQWNDVWLSEAFRHFDIRGNCQQIKAPLLLVQGDGDEYGSLMQLQWVQDAAPQALQVVVKGCGHSPHRDQPDILTGSVVPFLAGLP